MRTAKPYVQLDPAVIEQAHEVGVKLAEKMWGNRFQVIVTTHQNTECLHNHFVVNSVSFADGRHYHDNKKNLRLLQYACGAFISHGWSFLNSFRHGRWQYILEWLY